MKAEKNEFSDRYIWSDSIWENTSPLDCIRGISARDGSAAVNFFSSQPALNYGFYKSEKSWQMSCNSEAAIATAEEMKNVMRYWLSKGCDGFRVDMAGSLVKNDNSASDGNVALWQKFRAFLDSEYPNAAIVSEWGEPDKSLRGGFHMDFLLHFGPSHYNDLFRCDEPYFSSRGKGKISEFRNKYIENYNKTERRGLICIPSGNHDMDRLSRRLTDDEIKIAFAFLLSMPGAPFIYYGDEIGMRYVENVTSVEGGYNRTGSRSPMQWDNSACAGFSTAAPDKLYIPQDSNSNRPDVKSQQTQISSILNEVKKLISLRHEHTALQADSEIEFIDIEKEYPLCYVRKSDKEKILAVINPSAKQLEITLDYDIEIKKCIYSNGGEIVISDNIAVPPCSSGFYEIN